MALKKIKLTVPSAKRPIDPLEVFNRLTLRGSIENIWEPQAEALKEWHRQRQDSDVVVRMNTGGGKTLVGMLMAQSLVNETRGRVIYVCPNNQLVEQTLHKANEMSLSPATRYKSVWTNRDAFDAGDAFCLTNYASVFNGKSVFAFNDVQAFVFDDAHVAENAIRGQFTIRVSSKSEAHEKILGLFRKHFANSSLSSRFQDISDSRPVGGLFVPMFIVWQHAEAIRKTLLDAGVDDDETTLFAWEHMKDHLSHCCILADRHGLEITPAVLPLRNLPAFANGVRRVYLTATLPSQAAFIRTFGINEPTTIEPLGKSGDAQRLFVFVPGDDDEAQRDEAKKLVRKRKCCVVSPSGPKGAEWVPPATTFDKSGGQSEIDRFAESKKSEMLGLVARYDGIDLPGDACRILILDRLPTGEMLFDRFIDESIRVETLRTSHTATRIVQAIGRIFRSNTDHGIVLLVGPQLQAWLRNTKHAGYLPPLLQQQLLLASELAKKVDAEEVTWPELMDGLLDGDENWDATYNEYIDQFKTLAHEPNIDWYLPLVRREHDAFEKLWNGQYSDAVDLFGEMAETADKHDRRLAAWYYHWRGLALMCADDREGAFHDFIKAATVRAELGRPSPRRDSAFKPPDSGRAEAQAKKLANWYRKKKLQMTAAIRQVETDLQYGPDTGKAEEAMRLLGSLLGLDSERPDKSKGTGADVKWAGDGEIRAWGLELKTNKDADGEYSKPDIVQCHDHERILTTGYGNRAKLAIVGRILSVSEKSHPSEELRIVELDSFRELLGRVKAAFESVEGGDKTNLEQAFQNWLSYYGLLWPGCMDALDSRLAVDLRSSD